MGILRKETDETRRRENKVKKGKKEGGNEGNMGARNILDKYYTPKHI